MRRRATLLALLLPLLIACGGASGGGGGGDGIPEDCEIRVDGVCYMTEAEACAAASCPQERCLILESYPGQVECEAEGEPEPVEGGDAPVSSEPVAEGGACDQNTPCAEGLFCIGEQGCDVQWTCQPMRPCTRDLVTYCGCDGETFQGSGSCPSRPYEDRGPCPDP